MVFFLSYKMHVTITITVIENSYADYNLLKSIFKYDIILPKVNANYHTLMSELKDTINQMIELKDALYSIAFNKDKKSA